MKRGVSVARKAPVTPPMLLAIRSQLNLSFPMDCVFWSACLTMFFGLLRKSNLFCNEGGERSSKRLTRDCFLVESNQRCVTVIIKWSKTNQFKDRVLKINLPLLSPHPLCPVSAVVQAFTMHSPSSPTAPAFPLSGPAFA